MFDLVVVGLGPAGRALAHRAAAAGLDVAAVDPAPERVWTQTFGMWADEWPAWLPAELIAARLPRPAVATPAVRTLTRTYLIVDTAGLHRTLALDRVTVHPARAAELTDTTVVLRGGERICGRHVVDARGLRAGSGAAEQTAFGVILPTAEAIGALGGQAGWFMDWRRDNGAAPEAAPSFLYAVPLGGDRVLLEETCLAGRPALGLPELRSRLLARLDARGVTVPADPETEKVRFPLYRTGPEAAGPVAVGARSGATHPASGYTLATALAQADAAVAALRAGRDPATVLRPRTVRAVDVLRRRGLEALLALPPARLPEFFGAYFGLSAADQRAYLSGAADVSGVLRAMAAVFAALPWSLRRRLVTSVLRRPDRRPGGRAGAAADPER